MNFKKNITSNQVGFQMAPMIDIVFLLLIFFMAATLYAKWETKMDIKVPTADTGVDGARQPGEIIINIDRVGQIWVNDANQAPARLEALLAQVSQEFPDQPVIIRADAKTEHAYVISVLDVCRKVNIWNVAFAALPSAEIVSE